MIAGQAHTALNSSTHRCHSRDMQSNSVRAVKGEIFARQVPR